MAYHVDGSKTSTFVGALADELLDRAKCDASASKITQEDILERFIPSVNMMMQNLFGFDKAPTGTGGGKRQSFFNAGNPIFRGIGKRIKGSVLGMIPSIGIDLKTILNGVDCDPTSYKNGEPCRMKVDMKSVLGFDFGITAQKCFKNNPELRYFFCFVC